MPRSAQGSRAGSRSLSTWIGPAPMSIEPSATSIVPGEAPVDRIVAQQVRIGLHVAQVVESDDGEIGAAGFVNCAQDVAADPPEPVDGDANRHAPSNG